MPGRAEDGFSAFVAGPAWRDGNVTDADAVPWARSEDEWWRRRRD